MTSGWLLRMLIIEPAPGKQYTFDNFSYLLFQVRIKLFNNYFTIYL